MADTDRVPLRWTAYPGTMVAVFVVYGLLDSLGASVVISSYVAVVFGAAAVTLFEFLIPYDREWQPDRGKHRSTT